MTGRILVTGASGQLGSRILHHLLATSGVEASAIVAGSRDPAKLTDLAQKGVETRRIDFDDAASLSEGFAGIDRLLIVSTDALDGAGTRLRQPWQPSARQHHRTGVGPATYIHPRSRRRRPCSPSRSRSNWAPPRRSRPVRPRAPPSSPQRLVPGPRPGAPPALALGSLYSAAGAGKLAPLRPRAATFRAARPRPPPPPAGRPLSPPRLHRRHQKHPAALAALVTAACPARRWPVVPVRSRRAAPAWAPAGVPAPVLTQPLVSFAAPPRDRSRSPWCRHPARHVFRAQRLPSHPGIFLAAPTAALAGSSAPPAKRVWSCSPALPRAPSFVSGGGGSPSRRLPPPCPPAAGFGPDVFRVRRRCRPWPLEPSSRPGRAAGRAPGRCRRCGRGPALPPQPEVCGACRPAALACALFGGAGRSSPVPPSGRCRLPPVGARWPRGFPARRGWRGVAAPEPPAPPIFLLHPPRAGHWP